MDLLGGLARAGHLGPLKQLRDDRIVIAGLRAATSPANLVKALHAMTVGLDVKKSKHGLALGLLILRLQRAWVWN